MPSNGFQPIKLGNDDQAVTEQVFHTNSHQKQQAALGVRKRYRNLSKRGASIMDSGAYFLPKSANDDDFSNWHPLVPTGAQILGTNLFGDAFFADPSGVVHMLERGAASVEAIASSEVEFRSLIIDDREGWQLRPLVDQCRAEGKTLSEGQCYAFKILPVLGGEYAAENVWVAPVREWFALTADIYSQIKDVPDGTPVRLNIAKNPDDQPTKGKSGFFGKLFSK